MGRIKFYLGKIKFLFHFIRWREWELVKDEWGMTYEELEDAKKRLPGIKKAALLRILEASEHKPSGESK
jgi:hypothetical protein